MRINYHIVFTGAGCAGSIQSIEAAANNIHQAQLGVSFLVISLQQSHIFYTLVKYVERES
jgi:hypothetical protein